MSSRSGNRGSLQGRRFNMIRFIKIALIFLVLLVGAVFGWLISASYFSNRNDHALVFVESSVISENSFSFGSPVLACLRGPYAECQIDRCTEIGEGQFSIDIMSDRSSESILFRREIVDAYEGRSRYASTPRGCVEMDVNDVLRLMKLSEDDHSVVLQLKLQKALKN